MKYSDSRSGYEGHVNSQILALPSTTSFLLRNPEKEKLQEALGCKASPTVIK